MKLFRKENRLSWIVCAVMLIVALFSYPRLPDRIPTHFNAAGVVDGTGPRLFIFFIPGINALLLILSEIMPRIDPRSSNYSRFRPQYHMIHLTVTLLFFVLELYTVAVCFYPQLLQSLNMGVWMPILVGILIAICGNMMPKFKHNYFAGVKSPWTLADENVWYLTHRVTGKLWVVCGLLMIVIAFLPPQWKAWAFFPLVLIMAGVPYLYSYLVYRKRQILRSPLNLAPLIDDACCNSHMEDSLTTA